MGGSGFGFAAAVGEAPALALGLALFGGEDGLAEVVVLAGVGVGLVAAGGAELAAVGAVGVGLVGGEVGHGGAGAKAFDGFG